MLAMNNESRHNLKRFSNQSKTLQLHLDQSEISLVILCHNTLSPESFGEEENIVQHWLHFFFFLTAALHKTQGKKIMFKISHLILL